MPQSCRHSRPGPEVGRSHGRADAGPDTSVLLPLHALHQRGVARANRQRPRKGWPCLSSAVPLPWRGLVSVDRSRGQKAMKNLNQGSQGRFGSSPMSGGGSGDIRFQRNPLLCRFASAMARAGPRPAKAGQSRQTFDLCSISPLATGIEVPRRGSTKAKIFHWLTELVTNSA